MARVLATLMLLFVLSPGATAQQRLEVLGRSFELPAPTREPPDDVQAACAPRSPWLWPMLGTYAALQVADAHGTRRAIEAGAVEANPLMGWAVASDTRAYAMKASVTAGSWWLTEQVSCAYPKGALWMVVALNAVLALVVRHNYRIGTSLMDGR
ncbi:MAG: DUF5658 family protein [Acidobacteria bacterium]|nr:DUF5658 family protein [Acidobacteriota bacterium]